VAVYIITIGHPSDSIHAYESHPSDSVHAYDGKLKWQCTYLRFVTRVTVQMLSISHSSDRALAYDRSPGWHCKCLRKDTRM